MSHSTVLANGHGTNTSDLDKSLIRIPHYHPEIVIEKLITINKN